MNTTNLTQQKNTSNLSDFLPGDVVVLKNPKSTDVLLTIEFFQPSQYYWVEGGELVHQDDIRSATVTEIQAKRRLTEAEHSIAEVS